MRIGGGPLSRGDPTAFSHLGHMYAQGIGVEGDNATALEYFRKGAAKAHPPSQNGLGYMYMHGYGVAQSHKKALEYFKAAAEKGDATAWKTPPAAMCLCQMRASRLGWNARWRARVTPAPSPDLVTALSPRIASAKRVPVPSS